MSVNANRIWPRNFVNEDGSNLNHVKIVGYYCGNALSLSHLSCKGFMGRRVMGKSRLPAAVGRDRLLVPLQKEIYKSCKNKKNAGKLICQRLNFSTNKFILSLP